MNLIKQIENDKTYQQILEDSYGGVCYFETKEDYSTEELEKLFIQCQEENIIESFDGIMKGVYEWLNISTNKKLVGDDK